MEKISIIIPIYNASAYLEQCINSVLLQNYDNYELILINDGSTDGSLNICEKYKKNNPKIILINHENAGVSIARNSGLDKVTGSRIMFVDADDYLLPNAIHTLVNRLQSTNADLVLANSFEFNNKNKYLKYNFKKSLFFNFFDSIKHFALWGYLFPTHLIKKHNIRFIQDLAYSEDRVFILQLAKYCKSIAYENTPIYVYRLHKTSACASKNSLKKAHDQFYAAHCISLLESLSKKDEKAIKRHVNHTLKLGITAFTSVPFSKMQFIEMKSSFFLFFKKDNINLIWFYFVFILSYIKIQRRKIITFRHSKSR